MNRRHFLSLVGTTTAMSALGESLHATARPGALPQDERFWEVVRQQFPHPENVIYLNNGSLGISPRPVLDRMIRHLHDTESFEDREFNTYPWWGYANTTLNMRTKIAAFVGADPDEIALTRNATEGMNTVGSGLELEAGDEVLLSDQEHPGGRSPWLQREKRYGIAVRYFKIPVPPESPDEILQAVEDEITSRTKVISISHITTSTGGMLPVREISRMARDRGIISVIDGAHAMGQLPLDMHALGCDFYASSPHKWLFAPKGTGFLYCRKGMADRLWGHTVTSNWDRAELGVERLSTIGTSNTTLLAGLETAIEFAQLIGPETIHQRHQYLANYVREKIHEVGDVSFMNGPPPELAAAMVKVRVPIEKLRARGEAIWKEHGVWFNISDGRDGGQASIRFSCPYYILPRHLDRAIDILASEIRA